nr:hypothetical protein [uncultured Psychrobacter sp.]
MIGFNFHSVLKFGKFQTMNKFFSPKINMLRYFISCTFLFLVLPAYGQELWHGAEKGMSTSEVQKIFPNIEEREEYFSISGRSDDIEPLLVIDEYKLFDTYFKVLFFFKDNNLEAVKLHCIEWDKCYYTKDMMLSSLRDEFGYEAHTRKINTSLDIKYWMLDDGVNIRMFSEKISNLLSVDFQVSE